MNKFWNNKTVLVTGGNGFIGSSVVKLIQKEKIKLVYFPAHSLYDLTKEDDVKKLFSITKFDILIHLAAKVGGIYYNRQYPATSFYENTMINTLVFQYAYLNGIKKMIVLAAGCGYPQNISGIFKETDFFQGLPDEDNLSYSMAKKMLCVQSLSYRKQYNFNSIVLIPPNVYGPCEKYHPTMGHVLPSVVCKILIAKKNGSKYVKFWGSGAASREFLYVEDMAKAILLAIENGEKSGPYNVGNGTETSIKDLVNMIVKIVGYKGKIIWDNSMPTGQLRRLFDCSLFQNEIGLIKFTPFEIGIKKTINWYSTKI